MKLFMRARNAVWGLGLLVATMVALPMVAMAAEAPVNLGTTSTFAVLAGTGITNTGPTVISGDAGGDVGSDPTGTFTGQDQVTMTGAVHLADAVANQAKTDLVTAYDDAAGRTPSIIGTELGGQTLLPGVYTSESGTFEITGTLTLDAQGDPNAVFIFQTESTLVTATDSNFNLINGARYCRVFWKVGSSATLGVNSHFVGHLFALQSITANSGATVQGQLLARNGAVTLNNNTITNGLCPTLTPAIHVMKTAAPMELTSGPGSVTYTYRVTNPGAITLSDITIVDDKINPITYVSGDTNADGLLQPDEVWIYTATTTLTETTTNTVTVGGMAGDVPVSDTAIITVVVTPSDTPGGDTPGGDTPGGDTPSGSTPGRYTSIPPRSTIMGGLLPNTATPWHNLLAFGAITTLAGAAGWWKLSRKRAGK